MMVLVIVIILRIHVYYTFDHHIVLFYFFLPIVLMEYHGSNASFGWLNNMMWHSFNKSGGSFYWYDILFNQCTCTHTYYTY